jgi:hypothetical protein
MAKPTKSFNQTHEIHGMLEFLVHKVISLEHDIRMIETEALHQEAKRRGMTTNEVIHARLKEPRTHIVAKYEREHLLMDLDECGLTRLMEHYADGEGLKRHYHEKAKRERAEARRLKREAEKAAKK